MQWLDSMELAVAHEERINKMVLVNAAGYVSGGNYPLPFVIAQTPVLDKFSTTNCSKVVVRRFLDKL